MYGYSWCQCCICVTETGILEVVVAMNCAESGSERNVQSLKFMGQWERVRRYDLCVEQTEKYTNNLSHILKTVKVAKKYSKKRLRSKYHQSYRIP